MVGDQSVRCAASLPRTALMKTGEIYFDESGEYLSGADSKCRFNRVLRGFVRLHWLAAVTCLLEKPRNVGDPYELVEEIPVAVPVPTCSKREMIGQRLFAHRRNIHR